MEKPKKTDRISFRLSDNIRQRIEDRAIEEGRSISNFITKVLSDYLDKVDEAKNILKSNK